VFAKTRAFLADVKGELVKVTWPTKKDTYASTLVVVVLVVVVAAYLWGVDSALSAAIRALLG
jgi:preprotein translocase subunit SecE